MSNSVQPIKILKRQPDSLLRNEDLNKSTSAQKPLKTLEEREAAYAEARRRILGSSPTPEASTATATPAEPASAVTATTAVAATSITTSAPAIQLALPLMMNNVKMPAPPVSSIPYLGPNSIAFNGTVVLPQGFPNYPPPFVGQQNPFPYPYYYYQ